MDPFADIAGLAPLRIWEGVAGRVVHGERLSLAVVELEPGGLVAEHRHEHEQLGLVIRGTILFRVGDEERELGPGETWRIPGGVPHEARAGADGAVVVDVFSPPRDDWGNLEAEAPRPPLWPPGA